MFSRLRRSDFLALKLSLGCIAFVLGLPVLAAWRNVCPEVEVCAMAPGRANMGLLYLSPQSIPPARFGNGASLSLGTHYQVYNPNYPLSPYNNPVAKSNALVFEGDRAVVPSWSAAVQLGPTLLRSDGTVLAFDLGVATIRGSDGSFLAGTSFAGSAPFETLSMSLTYPPAQVGGAIFVIKYPDMVTFKSVDEGMTWTSKSAPGLSSSALIPYPYGAGLWVVGREGGQHRNGLYQSLDDGASWQRVDDPSAPDSLWGLGASLRAVAIDPRAVASGSGTVYGASDRGVLLSRDRGRHWEMLHAIEEGATSVVLAYHGATTVLLAGTATGVIASRDGGATWFEFSRALYGLPHHVYFVNDLLLAGSDAGWFICDDLDCGGTASFMPPAEVRGEVQVIEFYHHDLDHYFITSNAAEAVGIDAGSAGPGWVRTGFSFTAWTPLGNPMAKDICRFYGSPSPGPNSHFYSASAQECEQLHRLQKLTPASAPRWNFEAMVFQAEPIDPSTGACREGKRPVYRAYNAGFARGIDSNHRFVTDHAQIEALLARGWVDEGIAFCAKL